MYAYCEATVPKVTVVTRRGFGEGFEVMGSKGTRADFNFAWPAAEIEMKMPIGILDRQDSGSPYEAAAVGYLDDVIEPVETRARLMAALEACASKREGGLQKSTAISLCSVISIIRRPASMPSSLKPVHISDLVLRDAHQSLLATRMRTEDMIPIADKLNRAGYWSLEMWGRHF